MAFGGSRSSGALLCFMVLAGASVLHAPYGVVMLWIASELMGSQWRWDQWGRRKALPQGLIGLFKKWCWDNVDVKWRAIVIGFVEFLHSAILLVISILLCFDI